MVTNKKMTPYSIIFSLPSIIFPFRRCPWCNCYRRRKWTRRHEFKSWTRLIAFHIALIPLGKVWIQLFSLQLWVNSRADWVLYSHVPYHNDTIIKTDAMTKTQEDFFTKIYTSHFIARVRKGYSRVACERELEIEYKL